MGCLASAVVINDAAIIVESPRHNGLVMLLTLMDGQIVAPMADAHRVAERSVYTNDPPPSLHAAFLPQSQSVEEGLLEVVEGSGA